MPSAFLSAFLSAHLSFRVATLSPNHALALATLGVLLIFVELNRPGRIFPGALGLTLFLLATAALWCHPLQPAALLVLALASAALATHLRRPLPFAVSLVATIGLTLGFRFLIPEHANPHISTSAALTCGLLLGPIGTALSRIALRARRLKAVH